MDFEAVKGIAATYGATEFLGSGAESWVFALNETEIIRIQNPEFLPLEQQQRVVNERINLYAALNKAKLSFSISQVYEVLSIDPIIITKEKRIRGTQLRKAILNFPDKRALLYANYYHAIFELSKLPVEQEQQIAGGDPRLDLAGAFLLPEITHEPDPTWPTIEFSRYMQQEIKSSFGESLDRLLNLYRLYYVLLFADSSHPWVKTSLEQFTDILHSETLWVPNELRLEITQKRSQAKRVSI